MQETLFTWEMLRTIPGAAMAVFLVVLFTSRFIEKWWPGGTSLYAVFWSFVFLVGANIALGASYIDWRLWALCFPNAFVVALAAGKLSDKATTELQRRQGVLLALKNKGQDVYIAPTSGTGPDNI